MGLFGVDEDQHLILKARVTDAEARLGKVDLLLDRVHRGIIELESAPRADREIKMLGELQEVASEESRSHTGALEDLDRRLVQLTLAVAEGIERVQRAERRIQNTVARARRELAEHGLESPGIEAEHSELRDVDGDGSGAGDLPAVREAVAPPGPPPGLGIPGQWPS